MHLVYGLGAVDPMQQAARSVVLEDRRKFLEKDFHPPPGHVGVVVTTVTDFAPRDDAFDHLVARHFEVERRADGATLPLEPAVQRLCLAQGAREPIQHRAFLCVRLGQAAEYDLGHHVVGQQVAALHDGLLGPLVVLA